MVILGNAEPDRERKRLCRLDRGRGRKRRRRCDGRRLIPISLANFTLTSIGPTSARPPASNTKGTLFVDTTIGAVVANDGVIWRSVVNGLPV